ncbi:hypothetical protein IQ22_03002 [Pseudomonas duriflava]|uniref:Uncharacterized protein n=1 Tax=Pseudomonas duriflava TaxID=459528 RepID=A0A562Q8R5_9PSED|nr:hypothetical protein [Pseudomonas duriflava]TWI53155.1 hypothetical protein IQ22_03002 [Pseudomonas duriflava]
MKLNTIAALVVSGLLAATGVAFADDAKDANSTGLGTPDGSTTGKGAGVDVGGDVTPSTDEDKQGQDE